jgi:hypothetical protein
MNFKDVPDGYAIIPWVVDGVYRFYIGQGLFYSDDLRLGERRGQMHKLSPVLDEQKLCLYKNTFEEALEFCLKHPRS